MGEIVTFKTAPRRESMPPGGADAQILWFTGVRYMRLESVDEVVVKQPARPRVKRATPRRPRGSIVTA